MTVIFFQPLTRDRIPEFPTCFFRKKFLNSGDKFLNYVEPNFALTISRKRVRG